MSKEAMKLALEGAANYIDALGGDSRKYRQALANEALDKMAENARELGLDYEPAQPKYRRGDRLICLETEEYCVIHISGTDRQWVKFPDTHIGVYKNEQLAELFELLPKEIEIEQPAQQEQYIGETNVELGFYSDDASNGQQRELVGKVEMGQLVGNRPHESTSNPDTEREIAVITGVDEHGPMLGWFKHWINYPVGTKLYTSPPEQQEHLAWKNAAIRLGEELSSVGPDGYYDMTAEQWLDWAMDQRPHGKNSLPAQRTWVGLSDEDLANCSGHEVRWALYWDKLLKERNT